MIYIKRLLLGLLLLIPIVLIFSQPGVAVFEKFYTDITNASSSIDLLIKYPPGLYFTLNSIIKLFPPSKTIYFFYKQPAWDFYKFLLVLVYYLTFLSVIHLSNSIHKKTKTDKLNLALVYFGSISVLLTLALSFYDILAAPFLILSLSFLFRGKSKLAALFFLISLSFNWSLLILGPLFFLYNNKKSYLKNKIIPTINFLILPITLFITNLLYLTSYSRYQTITGDIFGFSWLINRPFTYILANNSLGSIKLNWVLIITISILLASLAAFIYLVKRLGIVRLFLFLFIAGVIFLRQNLLFIFLISLFIPFYLKLISEYRKTGTSSKIVLVKTVLSVYLVYTLFFPSIPDGNIIWITILGLIIYIVNKSKDNGILLLAVNLLAFLNLFVFLGSAGTAPVLGNYFSFFISLFSLAFILLCLKNITSFLNKDFSFNSNWLKKFLIIYLIIINLAFIPAEGSSDTVSWVQYAQATTQYANPFYAQTVVDQRYPPLSTVIMGIFANFWKYTITFRSRQDKRNEPSLDYALSIKLSIFCFYILTIYLLMRFKKVMQSTQKFKSIDVLLTILATFSLAIQTQGLADVNIYTIPALIVSIIFLYKKKYLLSGILLGIAISIKWQPIILVPLFGATLFNLKRVRFSIKRSLTFLAGLILIPIITWELVLVQPNGYLAFERAFDFLKKGAPLLSGQALNLNWIVTYILHIVKPDMYESLQYMGGLNRQIPTVGAPYIFQGFLFLLATFLILLSYWLFRKKNIRNFLTAALMIFFSHHALNKSAYEKHFFYVVIFSILLYLVSPTKTNRSLIILFDVMAAMNLIFFYGFTGPKDINRLFLGFDITIVFSAFYLIIYLWIFWKYIRDFTQKG